MSAPLSSYAPVELRVITIFEDFKGLYYYFLEFFYLHLRVFFFGNSIGTIAILKDVMATLYGGISVSEAVGSSSLASVFLVLFLVVSRDGGVYPSERLSLAPLLGVASLPPC